MSSECDTSFGAIWDGGCCTFCEGKILSRLGCKHIKVDQTSARVYESCGFLGQRPISSSKMLFKIDYFS